MVHIKIRLSPTYWIYSLLARLSVSRFGSWFFRRTKSWGVRRLHSRFGRIWWRFYLFNVILCQNPDTLQEQANAPIRITWLQEYHFRYWNAFFCMSALSHTVFELARGNRPLLLDRVGVWAQFFEQPVPTIADTDLAAMPDNEDVKSIFFTSKFAPHNKTVLRAWCRVFERYLHLNDTVRAYVDAEKNAILQSPEKTLGVICRGTDYNILKPPTHPKQPNTDDVIRYARAWMTKYGYEKIYLATEEEAIAEKFEQAFPGQILTNKRTYYDKIMKEQNLSVISDVRFDRENDSYLKGLEYLSSLYLLSSCDALVGGNCGGTLIASFLNNGRYTRTHIFDKGLF